MPGKPSRAGQRKIRGNKKRMKKNRAEIIINTKSILAMEYALGLVSCQNNDDAVCQDDSDTSNSSGLCDDQSVPVCSDGSLPTSEFKQVEAEIKTLTDRNRHLKKDSSRRYYNNHKMNRKIGKPSKKNRRRIKRNKKHMKQNDAEINSNKKTITKLQQQLEMLKEDLNSDDESIAVTDINFDNTDTFDSSLNSNGESIAIRGIPITF